MSKLSTSGPPLFGDSDTRAAYEDRVRKAGDDQTCPVMVAPSCSVTVEGAGRNEKRTLRELEPVPPGTLTGGEIARLASAGVLLVADPSRVRAVASDGARFRVAPRRSLTVCPPGEVTRIAGPGEAVEPSHVGGGLAQLKHLKLRGLLVERDDTPPPEAA